MPSYSIDATATPSLWFGPRHHLECAPARLQGVTRLSGAPLLIRDRQWFATVGIRSGSIFTADAERSELKFAGNSAIGTWTFADAAQKLFRQSNSGDAADVANSQAY
jgi:hypothetical protein